MGAHLMGSNDVSHVSDRMNAEGDGQMLQIEEMELLLVPWLESEMAALVRAIVTGVARRHADLRAAILFGSVARHEARPLDDAEPSDVDLLLVFDLEPALDHLPLERRLAVSHTIGLAEDQHRAAPREVNVLTAVGNLGDWDSTFVENVARDGILLWSRGPLPRPFASLPTLDEARKAVAQTS
ncbi:MAG TPA: nucleotidyltransferase domain-containing protein [Ktedonobacterales bacterium]|nr:nucleotidyltransferase domain-containing protein [Ktedonobacterales bacterium]